MAILIPKIIHRIWLGPNPLADDHVEYGYTWERHNPGWKVWLWTDRNLPDFDRTSFERGRNPVERADVLAYELLRQFGGIHADTDFECKRSFEPLLDGVGAFVYGEQGGLISRALMGFPPEHPALVRALEELAPRVGVVQVMGEATGPKLFSRVVRDFPDITVFPGELFVPYHWSERHRSREEFPDAYAVHHWGPKWDRATRQRAIQGKLRDTREKLAESERRRKRTADRLKEIEGSRWWRLGQALRAVGPRASRSGRERSDGPDR